MKCFIAAAQIFGHIGEGAPPPLSSLPPTPPPRGVLHHEVGGGARPQKKIRPNGSYKQLLKWGSRGETSWKGQGVNKAQPCTGVHGTLHAAGLNELCCSLALIPPLRI